MKRVLVTTSDIRTWPEKQPVCFLGRWCCLQNQQHQWESLDAVVAPYHWDDRNRYQCDTVYLQDLYECLLPLIANILNAHHQVTHGLRYWRILIGPWLYMFLHTLFDRWATLKAAVEQYEIDYTIILNHPVEDMIPADLKGVNPDSIDWNHYLFGQAIKHSGAIPWIDKPLNTISGRSIRPKADANTKVDQSRALRILRAGLALFTRDNEPLIIASYLPRKEQIKLQLMLGMVPKLWAIPQNERTPPDLQLRESLKIQTGAGDPFFQFACSMVLKQIPSIYLEGYQALSLAVKELPWPSNPKFIFTSNLFFFCEPFQAWAGEKAEAGVPLIFGQHGGLIGVGAWVPGEDHQVQISDRYLTWGWRDERPQPHPVAAFTIVNKPKRVWDPQGGILLVTVSMRVYSYKNNSWPVGPNQSESFLRCQLDLADALPQAIRNDLVVRIDARLDRKMNSFYVDRWRTTFPEVKIDDSTQPIETVLRQCRLFLYTYNATGFLETLGRDIPTLICWDPQYWELRSSALPYFEKLKDVGIFHDSPQSAAAHIQSIWSDVAQWWQQPKVQEARRQFCEQYACMPSNPLKVLKQALLSARSHTEHAASR